MNPQNNTVPQSPINQPTPQQPQAMPPATGPQQMPVVAAPVSGSGYAATMPGPVPTTGGHRKMGLILGLVGGIMAIIIAVLLVGWFMFWSPTAQSKRLSNSFMHSITTSDVAKATDLTGDSTATDFLTTASKSVHGSYKLSESKFTDGKGYYLYALSNADKKYARTIVEKDSGKRVVSSFVFSDTALSLVPSSSSSSNTSTASTNSAPAQPAPASTSTAACLTANDFSFFSNLGGTLPDPNADGTYDEFYQLLFSPDVATYAPGDNPDPTTVFNDFKDFYAQDANKKYTIALESSVNSASPDVSLANARNDKVQSDLETISGIPSSKITIQPIQNDTSGDSAGDAFYRQVQITLSSASSCSNQ